MRREMGKIVSQKKARAAVLVVLLGTTAASVVAQVAFDADDGEVGTAVTTVMTASEPPVKVEITDLPEVVADVAVETTVVAPAAAPEPETTVIEVEIEDAEPAAPAIDLLESLEMIKRGDVIRRQALISERKLILDREAQLIESIQTIVDEVGMEGLRAFYPELATLVDNSPMALRAEIDRAELMAALKELSAQDEEEASAEDDAAQDASAQPETMGPQGIMDVSVAPVGALVDDDPLAEMRAREAALDELRAVAAIGGEEDEAAPQPEPADIFRAFADLDVIEIYGMSGDLRAVLSDGPGVTSTVRAGDVIKNATILEVAPSYITVALDLDPFSETDEPLEGRVAIRR